MKTGLLLSLLVMLTVPFDAAMAGDASPSCAGVVYKLYKDYAWQAVLHYSDQWKDVTGPQLADQPYDVLNQYFDDTLSSLIVNDATISSDNGEVGVLEFDPIFSSQDPAASDLEIKRVDDDTIGVTFVYPSSSDKVYIEYKTIVNGNGCRIHDIIYHNPARFSLRDILGKKRP